MSGEYGLPEVPRNSETLALVVPEDLPKVREILRRKPVRTLSVVAVVAVMTSPAPCPHGKCTYCPGGVENNSPQSLHRERARGAPGGRQRFRSVPTGQVPHDRTAVGHRALHGQDRPHHHGRDVHLPTVGVPGVVREAVLRRLQRTRLRRTGRGADTERGSGAPGHRHDGGDQARFPDARRGQGLHAAGHHPGGAGSADTGRRYSNGGQPRARGEGGGRGDAHGQGPRAEGLLSRHARTSRIRSREGHSFIRPDLQRPALPAGHDQDISHPGGQGYEALRFLAEGRVPSLRHRPSGARHIGDEEAGARIRAPYSGYSAISRCR